MFGSSLQNVNASGIYMDDGVGCVVGVGVELESELRHLENNALARAALVEQMLFLTALSRSHTGNKDIFNISTLFGSTLLDWMRSKLTPLRILEMENSILPSYLLPGPACTFPPHLPGLFSVAHLIGVCPWRSPTARSRRAGIRTAHQAAPPRGP